MKIKDAVLYVYDYNKESNISYLHNKMKIQYKRNLFLVFLYKYT